MKYLAVFFSLLTLLLSVQPSFALARNEVVSSCCSDEACSSDEDDSGTKEEAGACNPFQCHSCCFVFSPAFPVFNWLYEPVYLSHGTVHTTLTYPLYPPSFWQPPKIA